MDQECTTSRQIKKKFHTPSPHPTLLGDFGASIVPQNIFGLTPLFREPEGEKTTTDMLAYKSLFGLVHVNSNAFFALINQPHLRGYKYVIVKERTVNTIRESFFK